MPIKGRQGRSKESRKRAAEHHIETAESFQKIKENVSQCFDCHADFTLVEDHQSGDIVCTACGVVQPCGQGLGFMKNMFSNKTLSRPYFRPVHFRQRIAQLLCHDPKLPRDVIKQIGRELIENEHIYKGNEKTYGKFTFSQVLHRLSLDRKQAKHWIQIRQRLNFSPLPPLLTISMRRLAARFFCISQAFQKTLFIPPKEKPKNYLQRRNIINLNYTMVQLWRLEDAEEFCRIAPYLPQLSSDKQPNLNNNRWKILIEEVSQNFTHFEDPCTGEIYSFNWEYIPLSNQDIIKYFQGFHYAMVFFWFNLSVSESSSMSSAS